VINVLELSRINDARIVYASSYVYGSPRYLPVDEGHPVSFWNPYAGSKIVGENLCRCYHESFGLRAVILRPFNIYGDGQDLRFLIPSIIDQARKGSITLKDRAPRRDYVFIDDVVDAYTRAIEYDSTGFEVFNIGSGVSYSVDEVVEVVRKTCGNEVKVSYIGETRKNEIMETVAGISKARRLLGWDPVVDLEQGIKRVIEG
jgi:nucleoside-diphosphate-sugar epimerase